MALARGRRLAGASGPGLLSGLARVGARLNLTLSGVFAVLLVVVGWLAARSVGARTLYLMVYAAVLAIVMAWFVSRRRLGLDVERSDIPLRMRAGQTVSVELTVRARRRVSTIVLEEQLPPGLGSTVHVPVASLAPGEELVHRYVFKPERRGVYPVGPVTATWSDPFGLTTQQQALLEPVDVIVHPTIERVRDRVLTRMWEDPPVRPPVSKPWPVGFEFYGMRDYVPGDDLRRVVWSALAKTGKMLVRESEQGITDRVVIAVDTGREWHSPGPVSVTFETAVKVAASVGVQHLEDGFSVTLLTGRGRVISGARQAKAHLPYLDALARLELEDGSIEDVGHLILEEARTRPHMLVVTPHLTSAAAQQLKLVIDRGVSVAIAKVLWEESDPTSLARAAALGAQIVQVPAGASLEAVFSHQVGAGRR